MKTRRLTAVAMLMAMNVVLCTMTPIKLQNFKFTLEAFPILVAGFLMGPLEGFLVGGLGSFIYQLFFSGYGFTPTTLLWVLPHAARGLLVGFLAKDKKNMPVWQIVLICVLSALLVTALNTLALYVDSRMYGYYSDKLVFGSLLLKIASGAILAVLFSLIMPLLIERLKPLVK